MCLKDKKERGAEKKQELPVPYITLGKMLYHFKGGKSRNCLNIYNPNTKMRSLLYWFRVCLASWLPHNKLHWGDLWVGCKIARFLFSFSLFSEDSA